MIIHPQFNPIAIQLGPINIHWYGLMYIAGFIGFFLLAKYQVKHKPWVNWNNQMIDDVLFYGALGVILGGRVGYTLFYQFDNFLINPLNIFKIWEGGMSFHGGFLGVLIAMYFFQKKYPNPWLKIMDFVAPLVPVGLGFGRMGNFINGELWGRPTNSDYGMVFPMVDQLARHPSQLYELLLEGVLMFLILWFFSRKQRPVGAISGLFLILYGSFRFIVEFTRQPDAHLGLLQLGLSMGQWLSLPMILIGIWMFRQANLNRFES